MLKNTYGALTDPELNAAPEPFRIPPVPCGDYETTGIFGETYKFSIRRMPRARRFTGHYGLFFDDPDAGDILIAVLRGEEFESIASNFDFSLANFVTPKEKKLLLERCCWCGRKLDDEQTKIHYNCLKRTVTP